MNRRVAFLIGLLCAPAAPAAFAAVDLTASASTYSQSFDSLARAGSNLAWTNDATLAGWSLFASDGSAATSYGTANTAAGGFRSFGTPGGDDRALGAVGAGSFEGHVALALRNAGSGAFGGVTIGFDGEQWRNGGNAAAQTMAFEYGFGSSFAGVTGWLAPGAGFGWASPVVGNATGAVDGNVAGRVGALGGPLTVDWQPGDTLWLRWAERNDAGNDHSLAIDNFSLSAVSSFSAVSAVPEPASAALLLAGLAATGLVVRRRRE